MATLATNRKLEIGNNFMLDKRSSRPPSSTGLPRTPTASTSSNGDEPHDQQASSPPPPSNGHLDARTSTTAAVAAPPSKTKSYIPPPDECADDLENSSQTKVDNLPPEKQLGKLKRFLQTVYSFTEKVPSQKERVKQLMVDLINNKVTAQEFYVELRGSTKFPLRPFVVPFLQCSLPLLRSSLSLPFKPDTLETELFGVSPALAPNGGGVAAMFNQQKRSTVANDRLGSTTGGQNGSSSERKRRATATSPDHISNPSSPKRTHFSSQQHSSSSSSSSSARHGGAYPHLLVSTTASLVNGTSGTSIRSLFPNTLVPDAPVPKTNAVVSTNGLAALATVGASRPTDPLTPLTPGGGTSAPGQANMDWWTCQNEEWRNIETLFTTMATTMERLRYALLLYQQRARLTQLWNEKFQQHQRMHDSNMKIEEMQRRADAAVHEVKRAAVSELQKAVHAAEQKALHMIATERVQMEKLLRDTQVQEENDETCRNCGRRAGQTCSGCGRARYCGVFCQHKDWPRHRAACSTPNNSNSTSIAGAVDPNEADDLGTAGDGSTDGSHSPRMPPTTSTIITIKTEFSPPIITTSTSSSQWIDRRVSPKSV